MTGIVLLAVLIVGTTGYGIARAWRFLAAQWFLRVLWQFLTGWHPDERPGRHKRAARRWGGVLLVLALVAGFLADAQVTAWVVLGLLFAAFGLGCWWVWHTARQFRHRRTWLRPLHLAACDVAGIDSRRPPHGWLQVERDRSKAVLALPAGWPPDDKDKQRLAKIAADKLGIEAPEVSWRLAGPKPLLTLTASQPPPPKVGLADVRQAIDRASLDELVWGLGRKNAVVTSSLSSDSPHLGLSMGSGAGKSVTARFLLAQMLYKGCIGLILDYKMISHQWAAGLPNVAIARRPAEIHAALLWLGREVDRRNEVALAGADWDGNVHAVVGPRLIVVCEELPATVAKLRAYWRQVRESSDPVRSPALEALDAVSFMGRQVLCNVLYIAQRLSVKASGGDGDARENVGVIAFGRYSTSNWKMLAGDHPMPPSSRAPGRIQVVDTRVREVQGALAPAREARALALAGSVASLPAGMPGAPRVADATVPVLAPAGGPDMRFVSETPPVVPGLPGRVTLSEAVTERIVSCSLHAVRKASQRDPDFPGGVAVRGLAKLYDATELALWDAGRR